MLNPLDPWLPIRYNSETSFDEMATATWHANAFNLNEIDTSTSFCFGIEIYTDKTGKGILNPYTMEPIMFTTTLINDKMR